MRSNWRGCKEWIDIGTPISTPSDEASKNFDAVLTQYVGWYEEVSVGGLENSINKMIEADPNFVLGHALKNGIELAGMSKTIYLHDDFKDDIDYMIELATSKPITSREKKHASAVKLWAEGDMEKACTVWEDILMENPTDMLALKFAHDCYFCRSHHPQMRDSIARVLPFWKSSMPLYGYLLGMYAFGLEETCLYDEAAKQARKALEIQKHDAWATHALAHVYEMTGKHNEGIQFMSNTEKEWNVCSMTACHNYWHYGLFYIEMGNFEDALGIFDNEVGKRALKSKSPMEVANSASYLHRLQLEGSNYESGHLHLAPAIQDGVSVGERFKDLNEICQSHIDDHIIGFIDASFMMASVGADDKEGMKKLIASMEYFIENRTGNTRDTMKTIGLDLYEAFVAFKEEEYSKAVDLLYPKRYLIKNIGGSNAQRDVFNLLLIHAALKSEEKRHNKLARMLLSERKCLKENSPLTDRLITKALSLHID